MADRMVVYSSAKDALPVSDVADRLRAGGATIIEETPHMLLVEGGSASIGRIVDGLEGWGLTAETKVSPPPTRERISRRP